MNGLVMFEFARKRYSHYSISDISRRRRVAEVREEQVISDITVIGGGLAGVCAAVAAARLGRTVSLVQNRPVLGGNSSSEVRVWVCGATAHGTHRYARETGIMGELFVENQYRNIDGNPYLWDLVVLEAVRAEPNIRLFLNTDVHEVEAEGGAERRRIRSVTGWMMGSERKIRFESGLFLDCSGDGLIGFLAGAKHRLGREARSEYNEEWAPEVADDITLGSTLLFYTKDAGQPVRFVPPSFAKDIAQTTIPLRRVIRSGDSGCHYWWIEWGGELDTVHDNERIRDELWSVIYGIWDYIKNSGRFEADRMTLEWVGSLPGKREYRRFIGDYVLNQNDILAMEPFADRVAFGGWSIDLHPPQGMYASESGSKHLHTDGSYHIPYRSLYSANVDNLLFAGRNISASHVAFGTTRVMATCAVMGEAAGTAAALCARYGLTPAGVYRERLGELQQTLLRQDASVLGVRNADPADMARQARASASSTLRRIAVLHSAAVRALERDVGLIVPHDGPLNGVELLVDAAADTELTVELWETGRPENYVPKSHILAATSRAAAGDSRWIAFPEAVVPAGEARNLFLIVRANPLVSLHLDDRACPGVLAFVKGDRPRAETKLEDHRHDQPVVQWSMKPFYRQTPCFRLGCETAAFAPDKALDGYQRPYGGPHMWVSGPLEDAGEAWLELAWENPRRIAEMQIVFNDQVNEDLINLHHHRNPHAIIPELVKDYRIEAWTGDGWRLLHRETGNRRRRRVHRWDAPPKADRVRLVAESTNGSPYAEVIAVRIYEA